MIEIKINEFEVVRINELQMVSSIFLRLVKLNNTLKIKLWNRIQNLIKE